MIKKHTRKDAIVNHQNPVYNAAPPELKSHAKIRIKVRLTGIGLNRSYFINCTLLLYFIMASLFQELCPLFSRASCRASPASTRTGNAASGSWTSPWGTARASWFTDSSQRRDVTWASVWERGFPALPVWPAVMDILLVIVSIFQGYFKKIDLGNTELVKLQTHLNLGS